MRRSLEPPPTLHGTALRPYQKQALGWMVHRESDDAAENVMIASWRPYALPDGTTFYLNEGSGVASPSQEPRQRMPGPRQ